MEVYAVRTEKSTADLDHSNVGLGLRTAELDRHTAELETFKLCSAEVKP